MRCSNFYETDVMYLLLLVMSIWFVEFSRKGYKVRKNFAQESTYPKEIIEFLGLDYRLMASCQKQGIILVIQK